MFQLCRSNLAKQTTLTALLNSRTYPPNPNLTPCLRRNFPIASIAFAAASQPPSPQNKPFHPCWASLESLPKLIYSGIKFTLICSLVNCGTFARISSSSSSQVFVFSSPIFASISDWYFRLRPAIPSSDDEQSIYGACQNMDYHSILAQSQASPKLTMPT